MKLQLNGAPLDSDAPTLAALLEAEGFGGAKVATAVNGSFIPASLRASHTLSLRRQHRSARPHARRLRCAPFTEKPLPMV